MASGGEKAAAASCGDRTASVVLILILASHWLPLPGLLSLPLIGGLHLTSQEAGGGCEDGRLAGGVLLTAGWWWWLLLSAGHQVVGEEEEEVVVTVLLDTVNPATYCMQSNLE